MAFAILLLGLATSVCAFLPLQKKCYVLTGLESKYPGRVCMVEDMPHSTRLTNSFTIFQLFANFRCHSGIRS